MLSCIAMCVPLPRAVNHRSVRWLTVLRVNYLVTCIAINLMLCVCFGLNSVALSQPIRSRPWVSTLTRTELERWYIGVSFFLGIAIEGVPALVGHYGWDPVWQDCYIRGGPCHVSTAPRASLMQVL